MFEFKGQLLRELRKIYFSCDPIDNAVEHIINVLEIASIFNAQDSTLIQIFPLTLEGIAKRWFEITSTECTKSGSDLRQNFIRRFCPPVIYSSNSGKSKSLSKKRENSFLILGKYITTYFSSVPFMILMTTKRELVDIVKSRVEYSGSEVGRRDESIDSAFARFNTIITSLKALDEGYSSKNYVRKFLRALHPKWRAKVTAIEESKDLNFTISWMNSLETSMSMLMRVSRLPVVKSKKVRHGRYLESTPQDREWSGIVDALKLIVGKSNCLLLLSRHALVEVLDFVIGLNLGDYLGGWLGFGGGYLLGCCRFDDEKSPPSKKSPWRMMNLDEEEAIREIGKENIEKMYVRMKP
ncbi:hypothetical protein Tco_1283637 [Tanacetum coccineum]